MALGRISLVINADLAELLVLAHSYDESIQQSRKTIEMDPNFGLAHNHLAQAYLQKQMNDEAVAELQQAVQLSGGSPTCIANRESCSRVRRIRQQERGGKATQRSQQALKPQTIRLPQRLL